jgi:hypothetical protein
MLNKLLIILGTFLLIGCEMRKPIIYADPTFTEEERKEIHQAVDEWCTATSHDACLEVVYSNGAGYNNEDVLRLHRVEEKASPFTCASPVHESSGLWCETNSEDEEEHISIMVNSLYGVSLKVVLLHELGHYFGLTHSSNAEDIMHTKLNPDQHLSKQDVIRYFAVHM